MSAPPLQDFKHNSKTDDARRQARADTDVALRKHKRIDQARMQEALTKNI